MHICGYIQIYITCVCIRFSIDLHTYLPLRCGKWLTEKSYICVWELKNRSCAYEKKKTKPWGWGWTLSRTRQNGVLKAMSTIKVHFFFLLRVSCNCYRDLVRTQEWDLCPIKCHSGCTTPWWITNGSLALTSLQTSICNCSLDIFHHALKTQSSYKKTHYLSLQNVSFYLSSTLGSHSILKPLLKSAILQSLLFFLILFTHQFTNWSPACKTDRQLAKWCLAFPIGFLLLFPEQILIVPSHSVSNL